MSQTVVYIAEGGGGVGVDGSSVYSYRVCNLDIINMRKSGRCTVARGLAV